jgi:hypothetical protein
VLKAIAAALKSALPFAGLLAVGLCSAPGFAASDQVLHAAYCMKVLDGMIAQQQRLFPPMFKEALEFYQHLARQRPLTAAEKQNYEEIQSTEPLLHQLHQRMQDTRSRLAGYVATSSRLLSGMLSNDENAFGGALADAAGIELASKRGESDNAQCEAEQVGVVSCVKSCTAKCTTDAGCIQQCATQCGAPACARTLPCMNPNFLPY